MPHCVSQVALTQLFLTTMSALLMFVEPKGSDDRYYFGVLATACQFGLPLFPFVVQLYELLCQGLDVTLQALSIKARGVLGVRVRV